MDNEIRNQRIRRQMSNILADNDVEGMRKYLESGGSVYSTISDQILLAMANSVEMAELLMDKEAAGKKGLQVAYKDAHGYTPFLTQANRSRAQVMRAIFQKYPHVIKQKNIHGKNALHICLTHAFPETLECVKFLLEAKIDINERTFGGYSVLDNAVMAHDNVANASIIKLLIDNGVNTTLHKHSATLPKAEIVKKYLAEKTIQKFMRGPASTQRTLHNAWRAPNINNPNNKGGEAYQATVEKVKKSGNFNTRRALKSRKALKRKSRKSRKN